MEVNQILTVGEGLQWAIARFSAADIFYGHGTDNPEDEAVQLMLYSLDIAMGDVQEIPVVHRLADDEKRRFITLVERRYKDHIPVPYLIGEAWFAGLPFFVDDRVLIPRSPIAELIDYGFEPWLQDQPISHVLDLCTGSGCIGIACAYLFEKAQVDLADLSQDALAVAQANIARHQLQARVNVIESDVFDNLAGRQYQLIVSNPPYVDQQDFLAMPREYQHEPALALASGEDGLDITRRILTDAPEYMVDDGLLVVEVGNSWVNLEAAFPSVPFTWLAFERGGHGVFVFTKKELLRYQSDFNVS